MMANSTEPSELERGKQLLRDYLKRQPGRIGRRGTMEAYLRARGIRHPDAVIIAMNAELDMLHDDEDELDEAAADISDDPVELSDDDRFILREDV